MGKVGGNKETVVKERDAADPSPNVHRLGASDKQYPLHPSGATGKLRGYASHCEESALPPAVAFLYSYTQFSKKTIKGVELSHEASNQQQSTLLLAG